jgi:isocitrate/isopropylmalate dehydrogenase
MGVFDLFGTTLSGEVAAIMGGLGLWGGRQIVGQARGELRNEHLPRTVIAGE